MENSYNVALLKLCPSVDSASWEPLRAVLQTLYVLRGWIFVCRTRMRHRTSSWHSDRRTYYFSYGNMQFGVNVGYEFDPSSDL